MYTAAVWLQGNEGGGGGGAVRVGFINTMDESSGRGKRAGMDSLLGRWTSGSGGGPAVVVVVVVVAVVVVVVVAFFSGLFGMGFFNDTCRCCFWCCCCFWCWRERI